MTKKKAFTLTELLVALGIIGTIAAISIPSLMNNINKQIYTTKLKSLVQSFKQTIDAELLSKKTTTLDNTDFRDPRLLFNNHFDVVKYCTYEDTTCWPNNTYKTLKNGTVTLTRQTTVKTRNGMTIQYNWIESDQVLENGDTVYLTIEVDLNGSDKPNIIGRDLFEFYISKYGKITDTSNLRSIEDVEATEDVEEMKALHIYRNGCLNGLPDYCYGSIVNNGWRMSY